MKIKSISILLMLVSVAATAQRGEDEKNVSFGIRAGVNFQNINGKDRYDHTLKNKLVTRFHAGINAEFLLAPDYYLQPGLIFSTKGAKKDTATVNSYYLELPINFIFKPTLGTGRMLLGFGPYLAYAIGGKVKVNGSSQSLNLSGTAHTQSEASVTMRPFDAGANFLVGYEFANKLSFQLNAQLGLVQINPNYEFAPSSRTSEKNTGYGLSVGYRF